jgi:putative phage-type endonuclease
LGPILRKGRRPETQVKERVNYIGGSDAAAIVGLSRWSSPLEVWSKKTGLLPEVELDSEAVLLGQELEDYVSRRFARLQKKKVRRVNETIYHPKYPFIAAHIDRRIVGEKAILEAKTTSAWRAKEWEGEDLPAEYVIQAMHYLAVTGADVCWVACLIGNQEFVVKDVWRDEKTLTDLVNREVNFWERFVVPKIMPEVKYRDKDILTGLFPQAETGKEIALGTNAHAICDLLEGMETDYKGLGRQIDEQKNKLRAMLKDADVGIAGVWKIRWKNVNASEFVVKRKASRKLTIKKKVEDQDNGETV